MTSDAWKLQGMDGAVPVGNGQTFTGLSRGVFLFAGGSFDVTFVNPAGTTATVTVTSTLDMYVPGPITVINASAATAIAYPESATYTVV